MADPVALDTAWLKAHPLTDHHNNVDKNGRGRVLVIGGCRRVPGGILLTAEAAFRAGAGKVTIATIESAAIPIGIAFPACAILSLPETADGEISPDSADLLVAEMTGHNAIVFGPAMTDQKMVETLLAALLPALPDEMFLLLDAFALRAATKHASAIAARGSHIVLTPHEGELAALLEIDKDAVAKDPLGALREASDRFRATIMVKGAISHLIADDACLAYAGGGLGLAMSGSGDVLAGLIAGLGAQGLSPVRAAAWGIWLHGEAGRRLGETMGPIGYLARELPPLVPGLMRGVQPGTRQYSLFPTFSICSKLSCNCRPSAKACPVLLDQIPGLEAQIDSAARGPDRFAVLGDWNRRLGLSGDTVSADIDDGDPKNADLRFADEGKAPGCEPRYDNFIDYIVLDRRAGENLLSFAETAYATGEYIMALTAP